MADDRVTAELAAIREDFRVTADLERLGGYKTHTAALRHGTVLLAAVEAVLTLTAETGEVDRDLDGNPEGGVIRVVRCDKIRAVIERELTGKDGTDA